MSDAREHFRGRGVVHVGRGAHSCAKRMYVFVDVYDGVDDEVRAISGPANWRSGDGGGGCTKGGAFILPDAASSVLLEAASIDTVTGTAFFVDSYVGAVLTTAV